jgi:hypothetical protein
MPNCTSCQGSPYNTGVPLLALPLLSQVDFGFLLMDSLIGYSLLTLLALLSFSGVVGWLQALLLFNPVRGAGRRGAADMTWPEGLLVCFT